MSTKKSLSWVLFFSVLGLFTVSTVSGMLDNHKSALASVVRDEGSDKKDGGQKNAVIFKDDERENGQSGSKLFRKFSELFEDDVICQVNTEQFQGLASKYNATKQQITVDGKNVSVVSISHKDAKKKDILKYLASKGETKCKVVKAKNWFYLLFSANMS